MNNSQIYLSMHFELPVSLEKTSNWFRSNMNNAHRVDLVFEDSDASVLAMGGLTNIDYTIRKAELYIFVNPDLQKRGVGSQVTFLLCKYAFEILYLHKVYLCTNENNVSARKVYEKTGFHLEGVLRDELYIDGQYTSRIYYGLLVSDFDKIDKPLEFVG